MSENSNTVISDMLSVATENKFTDGGLSTSGIVVSGLLASPAVLTTLVAAGAYCIGKLFKNVPKDAPTPKVVESKDGKTVVYNVQNLNVYINAELVQQLNVDPKEVINKLSKEIEYNAD